MSATQPHDGVLEFEDSQVSGIHVTGADLQVVLSAARVRGLVGGLVSAAQETEGYLAPVVLVFRQAHWQGERALALGRLQDGELWLGGQRLRRLPLPCEHRVAVRARLAFANGVVLDIEAQALECPLAGDEKFTPSLAC